MACFAAGSWRLVANMPRRTAGDQERVRLETEGAYHRVDHVLHRLDLVHELEDALVSHAEIQLTERQRPPSGDRLGSAVSVIGTCWRISSRSVLESAWASCLARSAWKSSGVRRRSQRAVAKKSQYFWADPLVRRAGRGSPAREGSGWDVAVLPVELEHDAVGGDRVARHKTEKADLAVQVLGKELSRRGLHRLRVVEVVAVALEHHLDPDGHGERRLAGGYRRLIDKTRSSVEALANDRRSWGHLPRIRDNILHEHIHERAAA
jgi:hypothetical protein